MEVRRDLNDVEALISRLLSIGEEYRNKDKWWSHLKNNEDWGQTVWPIKDGLKKAKIERVYADGRDMGLFMSDALAAINYDMTTYPTLTSIIKRFENTWVYNDLQCVIDEAQQAFNELSLNSWAFNQMVSAFEEQMKLAEVVKQTLSLLAQSNLYKLENGLPVENDKPSINIQNVSNSNIAVQSEGAQQSIAVNEQVFEELLSAIKSSDIESKEPLITAVEEMQAESKSGSIGESYKSFIGAAANHMTLIAPFIPALTAMI
ncbi:hypothetical protein [Shewanella algae]|uniref:hypothetical protein n=1 Tax=Shewanella algae TaxID=38313 RepID=UPI00118647F9|nr:hypothetical protein [Shewanella algae]TVP03204.1 hypothetical protein AYI73_18955 [Shewanella algae]BCV41210.1 hypothetical protein TUM17378_24720 [Shewanella algae]